MLYLTSDPRHLISGIGTGHVILTPDPRHLISDNGTWHVILDTWSMTLDIWHRYLTCYTWHLISVTGTWHVIWHLISDTGTWHVITWHLIPNTWYMTLDDWHAITHLTCFHMVQAHLPDIVTPDWILLYLTPVLHCIFMTITFTGTWHDYYIVSRHLVLLNSCAPELLYTWTPQKGRLLILYSCWSP